MNQHELILRIYFFSCVVFLLTIISIFFYLFIMLSLLRFSAPNYIFRIFKNNTKYVVDSHLQYVLRNIKICFLDRGLLITRKLLNHVFLLVNLFIYHNQVLPSFMTYSPVCNRSNTTRAPRGAGTAYPSGASEFIHGFIGVLVAQSFVFCVVFCRLLFVFIYFWTLYWLLITKCS